MKAEIEMKTSAAASVARKRGEEEGENIEIWRNEAAKSEISAMALMKIIGENLKSCEESNIEM
jgi:hypothetical protein